jgi:serine/threonine protein kinase
LCPFLNPNILQHDVGGLIDIKHPFEIDQIRVIMKQLLEVQSIIQSSVGFYVALTLTQVLSFLHEKGILHRDIKTSNLLLTNRLQVLLDRTSYFTSFS